VTSIRYATKPCAECPFRLDAPPGQFEACRFDALRNTAGGPGQEAPIGSPMFACHKTAEGKEIACAGWLAICGIDHLGVRYAVASGALPAEALQPGEGWPELFGSYEQMAARQAAPS
jgi:hypothetical protein